MRDQFLRALVICSMIAGSSTGFFASLPKAQAQDDLGAAAEDELDDLSATELDSISDEAPPKPEYPYPGAAEEGFSKPAPVTNPGSGSTASSSTPPPLTKERPVKISDEGEYQYSTDLEKPKPSGQPGITPPKKTNEAGEYFYQTSDDPGQFSNRPGVEKPIKMTAAGAYHYEVEHSPQNASASFRFGFFVPPKLENRATAPPITFKDVYGGNNVPVIFGDYEWQLTRKVGRLGIKFGSGLFVATGKGRFKTARDGGITEAEEKFTFITFPNQLTASYRFQYADEQVIVPFAEGGAGYFTYAEVRDDNAKPKFGGAPVAVAAGGANILLDWLDRGAIRQLDNDYGINHVWLTVEYRQIVGLKSDADFTSGVINGGFMMEF